MPLFATMSEAELALLASRLTPQRFRAGEAIIRQGEIGEKFYVIESGRVEVSVEHNGEQRVVAQRGPGEYVGEIALLLSVPRTASVRAVTHVRTLVLARPAFERLVAQHLLTSQRLQLETSRRMMRLRQAAQAA